jgi:hypothetical protein
MKNLSFLIGGLALSAALLSGCMSMPDPRITSQSGMAERTAGQPNILLVFRIALERRHYRTTEQAETLYHLAGKEFVKRIEALGGQASYKIISDSNDLEIPVGHTHVLVENIKQISMDGRGFIKYRVWDATLWVTPEKRPARKVFTQVYESDGIICFSMSQFANRADCQVKYIDHFVGQLAPVFPAK